MIETLGRISGQNTWLAICLPTGINIKIKVQQLVYAKRDKKGLRSAIEKKEKK